MLKSLLGTLTIGVAASACLPSAASRAVPLRLDARHHVTGAPAQSARQTRAAHVRPADRAFLDRNCVVCHNQKLMTAGLALDAADLDDVPGNAALWERVVRKLRSGAMPPPARPRPDPAALDSFATHVEGALDAAAALKPTPGRPALHRLNRAEYKNAVRDLLALDVDVQALLPPDDAGYGFDNIGDVLTVSPMLMERYMSAAGKISRLAVGIAEAEPASQTYTLSKYLRQHDRMSEDLPFGSRGGMAVRHNFPATGQYDVRVRLLKNHRDQIRGMSQLSSLEVRLDGRRVKLFDVGRDPSVKLSRQQADAVQQSTLHGDEDLNVRVDAAAGPHLVTVSFLDKPSVPEGVLGPQLSVASFGFSGAAVDDDQEPAVWTVRIDGPFEPRPASETPSRRRIFICQPEAGAETSCARAILGSFARRAYRRPVSERDLGTLLSFWQQGRAKAGFDAGIELALRRILASPEFLFRIERDQAGADPSDPVRLTDLELASRLSFFLWSSIPDDELLDEAERGRLRDPDVLRQQTRRMLADPRAAALVQNFAGQWLHLRNMQLVTPDPQIFPEFDDNLREAFRRETDMFIESQLRENRSVLDLLRADYTFVNERLARHYGLPKIYGSHFRRVTLPDRARRGLLGHGSILTVTSYATRTSPVLRGKWLLENVLGAPPPPPPPNVPALKENGEGGVPPSSVRERMELHRRNPVCASCHAQMDPLGFALENFDAVGRWRTVSEGGTPIDTAAVLPSGDAIAGPEQLRAALLRKPEMFAGTVVEKLLTYAVGRGLEYYDAPAVRQIVRTAATEEYRWSALIKGVIDSPPFQMRSADTRTRSAQP